MIWQWHKGGGVLITGYEMFRAITKMENANSLMWKKQVLHIATNNSPRLPYLVRILTCTCPSIAGRSKTVRGWERARGSGGARRLPRPGQKAWRLF